MIEAILNAVKGVSNLASASPLKLGLIIVVLGMVGYGVYSVYTEIQSTGFNKCEVAVEKEAKNTEKDRLAELELKIIELEKRKKQTNRLLNEANETILSEEKKREQLEYEINNLSAGNICVRDPEFLRLYNESIGQPPGI